VARSGFYWLHADAVYWQPLDRLAQGNSHLVVVLWVISGNRLPGKVSSKTVAGQIKIGSRPGAAEDGIMETVAKPRCLRSNGTPRAAFLSWEDAVAFAQDPANHPVYLGDIAHLCSKCDMYHLSRPEWLEPQLTHQDAALLESMGVEAPAKVPGDFRCARCRVPFRDGIYFLILRDGRTVCEGGCMPGLVK